LKSTVLARRYAKALFSIALEKKILDAVGKELTAFAKVIQETPQLRYFFRSPEAGKEGKRRLIENSFQDRFSALFINFIFVLLEKGRQNNLSEIAEEFNRLLDKHHNRVHARTVSAVALSKKEISKITATLEGRYNATFEIENYVDPKILGGLILRIDGQVIDGSVRTQLQKMRLEMLTESNS